MRRHGTWELMFGVIDGQLDVGKWKQETHGRAEVTVAVCGSIASS